MSQSVTPTPAPEPWRKRLKDAWRRKRPAVLAGPVYWLVRGLLATVRVQVEGWDEVKDLPGGKILAGWHGRVVLAINLFRGQGVWTIISMSRDGEMQNRIFTRFGFKTIRGSTKRGGIEAAVESIRVLKTGVTMAFTPDGPRGPSGIIQPGMMLMARKSGAWLVPVGVSCRRRWLFKSWDRYMIPKPFTQGLMIFGAPMQIPAGANEEEVEAIRVQFEREMHRLEREAEARFGHPEPDWHAPGAHRP